MNILNFIDTETTGLPLFKEPSDAVGQPHIVQVAVLQVDADSKKVLQSLNLIVKPEGWEIPQVTIDIHGITNELANDVGVSEAEAVEMVFNLCMGEGKLRCAHNKGFDQRIVRIALKRYLDSSYTDEWAETENFLCTMAAARSTICKVGCESAKLVDVYEHLMGKPLDGAHSALADTQACMEVYFKLDEMGAFPKI